MFSANVSSETAVSDIATEDMTNSALSRYSQRIHGVYEGPILYVYFAFLFRNEVGQMIRLELLYNHTPVWYQV